jgi:hypothetical protein
MTEPPGASVREKLHAYKSDAEPLKYFMTQ